MQSPTFDHKTSIILHNYLLPLPYTEAPLGKTGFTLGSIIVQNRQPHSIMFNNHQSTHPNAAHLTTPEPSFIVLGIDDDLHDLIVGGDLNFPLLQMIGDHSLFTPDANSHKLWRVIGFTIGKFTELFAFNLLKNDPDSQYNSDKTFHQGIKLSPCESCTLLANFPDDRSFIIRYSPIVRDTLREYYTSAEATSLEVTEFEGPFKKYQHLLTYPPSRQKYSPTFNGTWKVRVFNPLHQATFH